MDHTDYRATTEIHMNDLWKALNKEGRIDIDEHGVVWLDNGPNEQVKILGYVPEVLRHLAWDLGAPFTFSPRVTA
jgi:hypothetical protein